ncbi:S8 family serine peptidase [Nonomuraea maritima]|uniref:S8 family serine peptidase n=1 Tax=Nonomuraea maritima TaxID=683260 RepID=UPI0037238203
MQFKSRRSRLLAAVTTLAMLGVTPQAYASSAPPTAPAPATGAPRTITLITGDKVTVRMDGDKLGSLVVQSPDGGPARARITTVGTDTFVYPDSAVPYIAADVLDTQLFNITALIAAGYDDARAEQLPLIVTYADGAAATARRAQIAGTAGVRPLTSINGAALAQDRADAGEFWTALTAGQAGTAQARKTDAPAGFANGVAKIWLDAPVKTDMAETTAQIGAPDVWAGGNTGAGVDVAVLDTGIDAEHPDLAGQIAAAASFVPGEDETADYIGHGTHVASTIAGTGAASGGLEKGVAPGARLDIGKVFSKEGRGQASWVIAGMEWAVRERHAKVVSMSLGTEAPTDGTDPLSKAADALSAETGALFTVSAGNSGPFPTSIGAPGAADAALTVGAVDGSDQLADFSSQGPRLADGGIKPEVTAPGVNVLAARSHLAAGEGPYIAYSGTSMAAPHVAGAAALVAAAHPAWTGQQIKNALVNTVKATPDYTTYQAGAGRVDVKAAVAAAVVATASAYVGNYPLNHPPAQPPTKTVTWTNESGSDVTLDLALRVPNLPDGLLSLSADRVVVPAHGTAEVTITANLDGINTKENWAGRLEASSDGGVVTRTVVGIGTTDQPRHLVIKATDRDGTPVTGTLGIYRAGDRSGSYNIYLMGTEPLDLLLPEGTYSVWMWADVQGDHGPGSRGAALLRQDEIDLQANTTVNLDAATAKKITAVTQHETVDVDYRMDFYRSFSETSEVTDSFLIDPSYDSIWAQPSARPKTGDVSLNVRWHKTQPLLELSGDDRHAEPYQGLWVDPRSAVLPEGKHDMKAVFAGDGADYSKVDAKGRVAVVRRGDDLAGQVAAAQAAGAKLLLVVNDQPGRLVDTGATPLPVATLTQDEGEQLIARLAKGEVRLHAESHPTQDYAYDLVQRWDHRLPDQLTYRPGRADLAEVDVRWNYDLGARIDGARIDRIPRTGYTAATYQPVPDQQRRTEYVTASAGGDKVLWQSAWEMLTTNELQYGPTVTYKPGGSTTEKWFGPVRRPRVNSPGSATRQGDSLLAQIHSWGEAGNANTGFWTHGAIGQTTSLYQGDTLLIENPSDFVFAQLKPEALPYTLVTKAEVDAAVDPYSPHTETRWGFTSGTTEESKPLPLIQLDYDVDTDLSGKAARNAKLTVVPVQLEGVSAKIVSAGLEVSYDDGATWQDAKPKHSGEGWKATLHAPRDAQFATLRASAKDADGDTVEQTIVRAFGLK